MSIPRGGAAAAHGSDGRIYVFGGYFPDGSTVTSSAEAYDPATNTWSPIAPMPIALTGHAAVTAPDGHIYVIGGFTGSSSTYWTSTRQVHVYDATTNGWEPVAGMAASRANFGAALGRDGRIYVFGGADYTPVKGDDGCPSAGGGVWINYLDTAEVYSPETNTWTPIARMPGPRRGLGGALGSDGRIYAIGGMDPCDTPVATVEAYDPATNHWSTAPSMAASRAICAVAADARGLVYAIGGWSRAQHHLTAEAYDPGTRSWSPIGSLSVSRSGAAAAVDANGLLYAIGGWSADGLVKTVEAYPTGSGNARP
jgi:N-acetylneuraminic acid mutarotase